jgi:hypothetical protein
MGGGPLSIQMNGGGTWVGGGNGVGGMILPPWMNPGGVGGIGGLGGVGGLPLQLLRPDGGMGDGNPWQELMQNMMQSMLLKDLVGTGGAGGGSGGGGRRRDLLGNDDVRDLLARLASGGAGRRGDLWADDTLRFMASQFERMNAFMKDLTEWRKETDDQLFGSAAEHRHEDYRKRFARTFSEMFNDPQLGPTAQAAMPQQQQQQQNQMPAGMPNMMGGGAYPGAAYPGAAAMSGGYPAPGIGGMNPMYANAAAQNMGMMPQYGGLGQMGTGLGGMQNPGGLGGLANLGGGLGSVNQDQLTAAVINAMQQNTMQQNAGGLAGLRGGGRRRGRMPDFEDEDEDYGYRGMSSRRRGGRRRAERWEDDDGDMMFGGRDGYDGE